MAGTARNTGNLVLDLTDTRNFRRRQRLLAAVTWIPFSNHKQPVHSALARCGATEKCAIANAEGKTLAMSAPESVDEFLAGIPEPALSALQHLRGIIKAAVPEAEEAMVYGVAGFRLNAKPLACYAAFKAHCGFYPMDPAVIEQFEHELAGRSIAKGTIRFLPDDPLPDALVTAIVKARAARITGSQA
jgi:uncharacterized protein YdhG (YjbR/CyaY superfamily)